MHRMYGFRNSSSPYVINSNLYIRILVTVRCFHSCRHIPQLFYLQPHPARSKHMCRWYQKFVHNILTLLLDPQALCPRPLSFPNLSCSLTLKKQAICWMLSVYVDTFHFSTTSITFSFHVLLFFSKYWT